MNILKKIKLGACILLASNALYAQYTNYYYYDPGQLAPGNVWGFTPVAHELTTLGNGTSITCVDWGIEQESGYLIQDTDYTTGDVSWSRKYSAIGTKSEFEITGSDLTWTGLFDTCKFYGTFQDTVGFTNKGLFEMAINPYTGDLIYARRAEMIINGFYEGVLNVLTTDDPVHGLLKKVKPVGNFNNIMGFFYDQWWYKEEAYVLAAKSHTSKNEGYVLGLDKISRELFILKLNEGNGSVINYKKLNVANNGYVAYPNLTMLNDGTFIISFINERLLSSNLRIVHLDKNFNLLSNNQYNINPFFGLPLEWQRLEVVNQVYGNPNELTISGTAKSQLGYHAFPFEITLSINNLSVLGAKLDVNILNNTFLGENDFVLPTASINTTTGPGGVFPKTRASGCNINNTSLPLFYITKDNASCFNLPLNVTSDQPYTVSVVADTISYESISWPWENVSIIAQPLSVTKVSCGTSSKKELEWLDEGSGDDNEVIEILEQNGFLASQVGMTKVKAFPNPTSGKTLIDLGEQYQSVRVTVRDILGQEVNAKNYGSVSKINLDIAGSTGVYFVNIEADGTENKTIKIIKR